MHSNVLTDPNTHTDSAELTVDRYLVLIKRGAIFEGAPYELLDGVLVRKDRSARGGNPMSIGEVHSVIVCLIGRLGLSLEHWGCHLRIQSSISLPPDNIPEPDGAIIKGAPRDYLKRLPGPEDVCCVIEVSDSSLDYDRTSKLKLYARFNLPQYVMLNLVDLQAEVYEEPVAAEGRYSKRTILKPGDVLALNVGPVEPLKIDVAELLP